MFLDENGTFQSASRSLALLAMVIKLVGVAIHHLLPLDTDEHLAEQVTFQFLPGLSVLADT
jgi:hypothetical protein